jgi:ABC-type dipeptide/oligopeptide/nickel transport system permease subunit
MTDGVATPASDPVALPHRQPPRRPPPPQAASRPGVARLLRPAPTAGAAILLLFLVCAVAPGWIAPYDPLAFDYRALLKPPGPAHPFGTDNFGRDLL